MTKMRRGAFVATVAGALLVGGAIGATTLGAGAGSASTSTGTSTARNAPNGAFRPIESASHEAGESAQREAQEDAGQVPTVP